MKMTIANNDQLTAWLNERRKMGRDVFSIKGYPPKGATYDNGEPISRPVNIAWQDNTTGEVFAIEYEVEEAAPISTQGPIGWIRCGSGARGLRSLRSRRPVAMRPGPCGRGPFFFARARPLQRGSG